MQQIVQHNTVQYNIEITCNPCPEGYESQIARRLGTAFPGVDCRSTQHGLSMRLDSGHTIAEGAWKDFAELVAETLTGLGILMTSGVVSRLARQAPGTSRIAARMHDVAATLTGFDLRPVRAVPVLYFYKGLRFDLDVSERLRRGMPRKSRVAAA